MGAMMRQTECVDDILERVCEVTMSGIYRRVRQMGAEMECNNLSDVLLTMLDAQDILNAEELRDPRLHQWRETLRQRYNFNKTKRNE